MVYDSGGLKLRILGGGHEFSSKSESKHPKPLKACCRVSLPQTSIAPYRITRADLWKHLGESGFLKP